MELSLLLIFLCIVAVVNYLEDNLSHQKNRPTALGRFFYKIKDT